MGMEKIEGAKCIHSTTYLTTVGVQGSLKTSYTGCNLNSIPNYCPFNKNYYDNADPCPDNSALMAEIESCPEPMPTLGAALGYAGFIELAITIGLVFVLTRTGLISGGPKG